MDKKRVYSTELYIAVAHLSFKRGKKVDFCREIMYRISSLAKLDENHLTKKLDEHDNEQFKEVKARINGNIFDFINYLINQNILTENHNSTFSINQKLLYYNFKEHKEYKNVKRMVLQSRLPWGESF